ncbi:MAG: lipocalin-like domain-containing protein [Prevotella sp.]|nr:lipocalin-like domain-containing protein [Prevotella sp.]
MKKIAEFCFFSMMTLVMTGCEIHTSNNGDLDGFWQLRSIDTLSTGASVDARERMIYWAVQRHILEVQDKHDTRNKILFGFSQRGDSLFLYEPRVNNRDIGDTLVTNLSMLQPYGVNDFEESYFIEQLDGGQMVLKSKVLRLWFRKY